MPIAMSLAIAALLSAPAHSSGPLEPAPPPVIVTVAVASTVSPSLVTRVLAEAGDIWRAAGFSLVWDRPFSEGAVSLTARVSSVGVAIPSRLRVVIDADRGAQTNDASLKTLGWIIFEAGSPLQEIYLSYANAVSLFESSQGVVVGRISTMTVAERELLIGRVMGRALAHEIGHYLLASKAHTPKGLMQAKRGAAELFAPPRKGFQLEAEQRQIIAARLNTTPAVARVRQSDSR